MPTVKLPINEEVYRNSDDAALTAKNARLYDGYVDELGATHMRPGLKYVQTLATPYNSCGYYYWAEKGWIIVVVGGSVFRVVPTSQISVSPYSLGTIGASYWNTDAPVSFCTDGTYVFMANGKRIVYSTGGTAPIPLADVDAPTTVSHVAYLDGYILANSLGTNKFYWSNVNDSLTWEALNFASGSGGPDNINALHVINREIYLFGPNTFEIWENDGENPFSRIPGGFTQVGCIAPYSIINMNNTLYWLDNNCRIVRCTGHNVEHLSGPFDREIAETIGPANCRGFAIRFKSNTFLVFNFIADEKTFVFNLTTEQWSQWGNWQENESRYAQWPIRAHCFVPPFNANFVGVYQSDDILFLTDKLIEDQIRVGAVSDRVPIRLARTTGHLDHGTSKRKRSNQMRLRVKRGNTTTSAPAELNLFLRWKDDNINQWCSERAFGLGAKADTEMIIRTFRNGIYRTRQWEFVVGYQELANDIEPDPVVFLDAEEDIDLLAS